MGGAIRFCDSVGCSVGSLFVVVIQSAIFMHADRIVALTRKIGYTGVACLVGSLKSLTNHWRML